MEEKIHIFISYARRDELYLEQLEKHLAGLQKQGLIDVWDKRKVKPGTDWEDDTRTHLQKADVILLLISVDFLQSNDCSGEMTRAMQRYESGESRIIPILLRSVDLTNVPFSKLKVLPRDGTPLARRRLTHSRDEAWNDIAEEIRKIVEELLPIRKLAHLEPELLQGSSPAPEVRLPDNQDGDDVQIPFFPVVETVPDAPEEPEEEFKQEEDMSQNERNDYEIVWNETGKAIEESTPYRVLCTDT